MNLECEVKFINIPLIALEEHCHALGAHFLGKYFEGNRVFDTPERTLKEQDILLRLREKQNEFVLTVKCPPKLKVASTLKVFEEVESKIVDGEALRRMLNILGYIEKFAYEKIRAKFAYMDTIICLDHLPFGEFVEIEGNEETVWKCANALGLQGAITTKETYYELNLKHQLEHSLEYDESFVFSPSQRIFLKEQLLK